MPPDLDAAPEERFVAPAGEPPPLPAHSLDAVLDAAGLPLHLVDLRHTPPAILAGVTAMSGRNLQIDVDPKHAFDAVIHVRHITPAHGAADLAATEPES